MRHRELLKRLKEDSERLRRVNSSGSPFSSNSETQQQRFEKRQALLHGLELLLPEIIEKLENQTRTS